MNTGECSFESMASDILVSYTSVMLKLKMEEKLPSETSATTYKTTRHQNPENHNEHLHRRENLKSQTPMGY
jgi:hypothetical protein